MYLSSCPAANSHPLHHLPAVVQILIHGSHSPGLVLLPDVVHHQEDLEGHRILTPIDHAPYPARVRRGRAVPDHSHLDQDHRPEDVAVEETALDVMEQDEEIRATVAIAAEVAAEAEKGITGLDANV